MSTKQKFCSECGAPLEENDRFCPVCGAKVVDINDISTTKSPDEKLNPPPPHNEKSSTDDSQSKKTTSTSELEKELSQNDDKTSSENYNSNNIKPWVMLGIVLLMIGGGAYVYTTQENQKIYTRDSSLNASQTNNKMSASKKVFWADVAKISALKGDVLAGEAVYGICMGCHNGTNKNMYGVIPPNLDHAGAIYDKNYLIALIKDPAIASNVDHLYKDTGRHPMGSIKYMISDNQWVADLVAYIMKEKSKKPTPKQAFLEACSRCHAIKKANITQLGANPPFKYPKDKSAYNAKISEEQDLVKAYLGKLPPDLSNITNERSEVFLAEFINNPQAKYHNSAMPSIGLSKNGYKSILKYLKSISDGK